MAEGVPNVRYGHIVWAVVRDRYGFRKRRPAIVLTPTREIRDDLPLVVMAVTTSFPDPPPDRHVALPWNPDPRRVGTRLACRSAAVVYWLDTVYIDEIEEVKGVVPPRTMAEIQRQLAELDAEPQGDVPPAAPARPGDAAPPGGVDEPPPPTRS